MSESIIASRVDGLLHVEIARASKRNALDMAMFAELARLLEAAAATMSVP